MLELVGEGETSTGILVAFPLQSAAVVAHLRASPVPASARRFVEAVGPDHREHPALEETVRLREVEQVEADALVPVVALGLAAEVEPLLVGFAVRVQPQQQVVLVVPVQESPCGQVQIPRLEI